jgi:tRNA A-37 threonylcarbamoyl transferase component Bud32
MSNIADFLLQVDAFKSLSSQSAERLSRFVREARYEAGDIIVRKGEPGDRMFIVSKGHVFVPVLDDEGKQRFLVQLGERHFFGEMALLTGEPRTANVVAGSDCTCLVIPREALDELLFEYPQVASFLTEILGRRLMEQGGIRQVGKYRLVGEIARGGMAVVYEGVHPTLDRPVAIKMLSHALIYQRHFAERFRNEAKIIGNLRHPNIVEVYDAEEAYATFFIIMEKLQGRDLEKIVDARGMFSFDEVRSILRQVASALDYAHMRGIVHRDVKPSNIVLDDQGTVKLMDFGIAMVPHLERDMTIDHDMFLGTPLYTSPEQATGEPLDGRADIYSLGLVAFELLTGRFLFDSNDAQEVLVKQVEEAIRPPRQLNPRVPDDLNEFVIRCTQKAPSRRFQSCKDVQDFLGAPASAPSRIEHLGIKTVTFVFDPSAEVEVEALMTMVRHRAAKIPGVRVK